MAQRRGGAEQVLALQPAAPHRAARVGPHRQGALADRARLPGTQAGSRALPSTASGTTRAAAGAASTTTPASASRPTASWWPSAALFPLSSASPRDGSRHLRYPAVSSRAVPVRPERHVPNSIATIRRCLTVGLVHVLPRCPCCLQRQRLRVKVI
jgi:hypothetical protein